MVLASETETSLIIGLGDDKIAPCPKRSEFSHGEHSNSLKSFLFLFAIEKSNASLSNHFGISV